MLTIEIFENFITKYLVHASIVQKCLKILSYIMILYVDKFNKQICLTLGDLICENIYPKKLMFLTAGYNITPA